MNLILAVKCIQHKPLKKQTLRKPRLDGDSNPSLCSDRMQWSTQLSLSSQLESGKLWVCVIPDDEVKLEMNPEAIPVALKLQVPYFLYIVETTYKMAQTGS